MRGRNVHVSLPAHDGDPQITECRQTRAAYAYGAAVAVPSLTAVTLVAANSSQTAGGQAR